MVKEKNKSVLLIAYHFPPLQGSSGIQRTLKFAKYLSNFGWNPIVLTAHPRSYPRVSDDLLGEVPESIKVFPSFAIDTSKHLSIAGRYSQYMALPDRWVGWSLGAIPMGLKLIKKYQPSIIWSTFPIATAHLIGLALNKMTKTPWVADFRDSMTEEFYPADKLKRSIYRSIEKKVVNNCTKSIFTTPGALKMYASRYPNVSKSKWVEISNGFDEEDFSNIETNHTVKKCVLTFIHAGILYQNERNPSAFFHALAELHDQGVVSENTIKVVLRASGNEVVYQQELIKCGIEKFVFLEPSIAYGEALSEMMSADVLLLFQGKNCNHQIPAKVYEYIRSKRPILALTDKQGDTARLLEGLGINAIFDMHNKDEIVTGIKALLWAIKNDDFNPASDIQIKSLSRYSQTEQLASLFDEIELGQ